MDVYKITNRVNGKIYIGKTTMGYLRRWTYHKINANKGNNAYLYRAMRKHGIDNFSVELIDTAITEEELAAKEIAWIAELQTCDGKSGYNCTPGGDGAKHGPSSRTFLRGPCTPETKAKLRAANSGRKPSPERLEWLRTVNKGRKHPPEEIARRQAAINKVNEDPVVKARRSAASKAIVADHNNRFWEHCTPELLSANGKRTAEWWKSPAADATKERYREIARQRFNDPAIKARRAASPNIRWTEERKQAHRERRLGTKMSEESKLKMSIAAKKRCQRQKQTMEVA